MALRRRVVIDTGIFQTEEFSPGPDSAASWREIQRMVREANDLVGTLKRLRETAVAVRMQHCPTLPLALSHDALPPVAQDAAEVIYQLDGLGDLDALTPEEIDMLGRGYCIGIFETRMQVRPFEPHARRGKKQLDAVSKGGRAKSSQGKVVRAAPLIRRDFEAMRSRNPLMSRSRLCDLVAQKHGVSGRTVARQLAKQNL